MLLTYNKKKAEHDKTREITRDGHCEKEGTNFFYFDLILCNVCNTRVSYEYAYYILIFEMWSKRKYIFQYTLKNTILLFDNLKLKL